MARPTADDLSAFSPTAILGLTGLKRYAGRIYEEYLPELTGPRGRKVIKEMTTNDPIVGAVRKTFEMLLRQVSWDVAPFDESSAAEADADYLRSCMDDMSSPWVETIIQLLPIDYGWAYGEITYKQRKGDQADPTLRSKINDGHWGWRKVEIRAQDTLWRWEFDETGGVQGMWQMAPPHYKLTFLPIEKSLLFRTTTKKGNPEGESMFRNAYRPWYFKKHVENLEGVGIDRDLAGLPVLYVPADLLDPNASPEKVAALQAWQKLITGIKRDEQEGVILPSQYDDAGHREYELTLLTSGGTRQYDTNAVVQRKNQEMAMSCLADIVLLGHENVGSFALAESKHNVLATALGGFLDEQAQVFNTHAIPRLFKMDGRPTDKLPKITHGDIDSVDLQELAAYITALAGAGAPLFPNPDLERYLMETAGLPVAQEGMDTARTGAKRKPGPPGGLEAQDEQDATDEDATEASKPTDPTSDATPTEGNGSGELHIHVHQDKAEATAVVDHSAALLEVAKSQNAISGAVAGIAGAVSRMALKRDRVIVKAAEAPKVQVDVHVPQQPAPSVTVKNQNDVHVPTPPPPVLIQAPQPSKVEVAYETGPDGRQRPKSITRS